MLPEARADFSIPLFVALVTICAYLLFNKNIGGGSFALCIIASAIAVILLRNTDRLDQLIFRQGENQVEVRLQELKQEVYAKVEQLQGIAEGMASFVAVNIASENRLTGEDHIERMLRRRDDLVTFLRKEGVAPERATAIVQPIVLMADWDLRYRISVDARAAWRLKRGEDPNDPSARSKDTDRIDAALQQSDRLAGLAEVERLIRDELSDRIQFAVVAKHLAQYRQLIQSGRMPRTGPTDAVGKAPRL